MIDPERTDLLRRAALENAIASGEMEGLVFTPAKTRVKTRVRVPR